METEKSENKPAEPKQNGGARPGSGRKKGKQSQFTIERNEAKKAFIDRVARNADKLFNAQLDKAVGETYLMCVTTVGEGTKQRRETEIVTDKEIIMSYLDETLEPDDSEYYYISTKPTDNMAIQGLLDRAFGRASEKVTIDGETKHIHTLEDVSKEVLDARVEDYINRRRAT